MSIGLTLPLDRSIPVAEIPVLPMAVFHDMVTGAAQQGARLAALFAHPAGTGLRLYAVLASRTNGVVSMLGSDSGAEYPALTPQCAQAHLFERELAEQWGITPVGHPWLKPVRFPQHVPGGGKASPGQPSPCGVTEFFQVHGEQVHEVAVGPVHAGVIEPGHFRFQCHGETVLHLEISLGYQHRGIEAALVGGPDRKTLHYLETLAGDTTVGHAIAGCRALEALAGCRVPARAEVIRGVGQELERMANHIGDLGALAGDIGFLPTMSYCGRIRGDVLNLTAALCGNRFGRGLVHPGGVGYNLNEEIVARVGEGVRTAVREAQEAAGLLWETPSVLARFEGTGALSRQAAEELGLVGVAARATGLELDVRQDFPYGIFRLAHIPAATWNTGDVFARALVRWREVEQSAAFVIDQLTALPEGPVLSPMRELPGEHVTVSLVEGWRGEICHVAMTDATGKLAHYKVVDPSFHNWFGLALALRDQQISDFPLCNKSFNLSYCGHDL